MDRDGIATLVKKPSFKPLIYSRKRLTQTEFTNFLALIEQADLDHQQNWHQKGIMDAGVGSMTVVNCDANGTTHTVKVGGYGGSENKDVQALNLAARKIFSAIEADSGLRFDPQKEAPKRQPSIPLKRFLSLTVDKEPDSHFRLAKDGSLRTSQMTYIDFEAHPIARTSKLSPAEVAKTLTLANQANFPAQQRSSDFGLYVSSTHTVVTLEYQNKDGRPERYRAEILGLGPDWGFKPLKDYVDNYLEADEKAKKK